jgi:hypothetical protein
MRSQGLLVGKALLALNSWAVETGPVLDEATDVWPRIEKELDAGDVPAAAARLRRYAEFVARELADNLGAQVGFKGDGNYELGDLLPAALKRHKELLVRAGRVAKSWGNEEDLQRVDEAQAKFESLRMAHEVEQWALNKAVHYNEWANFTVGEFRLVVAAARALFDQFQCPAPGCTAWVAVTPKLNPEDLRCACGRVRFNLHER